MVWTTLRSSVIATRVGGSESSASPMVSHFCQMQQLPVPRLKGWLVVHALIHGRLSRADAKSGNHDHRLHPRMPVRNSLILQSLYKRISTPAHPKLLWQNCCIAASTLGAMAQGVAMIAVARWPARSTRDRLSTFRSQHGAPGLGKPGFDTRRVDIGSDADNNRIIQSDGRGLGTHCGRSCEVKMSHNWSACI